MSHRYVRPVSINKEHLYIYMQRTVQYITITEGHITAYDGERMKKNLSAKVRAHVLKVFQKQKVIYVK